MSALFDDRSFRDPDYAAAVDFCRELIPFAPDELLPGTHSANFCPIARTLDRGSVREIPDDLDRDWIESNGGLSRLFEVGAAKVAFPAVDEWWIDLYSEPSEAEIESYLARGYDYDESGGEFLRRAVVLPEPVQRFISRFDSGEFPSLLLEIAENDR